ncbi:DDHD-domain-containing protein [Massarina eburnea CBS 473.64]|uniref:DDHD-domain-containing protein n=1 Tax=Massarina eburnea CBS 473.64 TaxID=1395130 RepID=A0A6A6S1J8_9PLEO|nr:DDHD-domain-containing protein [Massarina eburnea CBS 473.64]
MSTPETKPGFLSAGINAIAPWGSRGAPPNKPNAPRSVEDGNVREKEKTPAPAPLPLQTLGAGPQRGGDHKVNRRHRLSLRRYPQDCPPLAVRWFHAVDIPKRKPLASTAIVPDKPLPRPKKWIPFSPEDSRAIENAFRKTAEEEEAAERRKGLLSPLSPAPGQASLSHQPDTSTKVAVNEDYLFDVEIETRELAPAYWLGPVYDVKRGTWFTPDGEPCEEHLATQLEEGYLKVKPWRFAKPPEKRAVSQTRARPISLNTKATDDYRKELGRLNARDSTSNPVTPQVSYDNLRDQANRDAESSTSDDKTATPPDDSSRTYRLFGSHMNSVVTYQDDTTAWILTDDMWSRMGSTLYQRFAGAAHYAGTKYVRGYTDPSKKKDAKANKDEAGKKDIERPETPSLAYGEYNSKPRTAPSSDAGSDMEDAEHRGRETSPAETRRRNLELHMSSLMTSMEPEDPEKQEEEIRKRDEKEMREDYQDQDPGEQGREIEHLLLVTHGIGQRLGMRMESINFILDVNSLRKSLKSVYANSPDLQALNSDVDKLHKNSRIQVLPICWRHLLDFPKQSLEHNRKEHDLGDLDVDDQEYPNLEDITVEGVPAVRNLLTDLALDILLYQSPAYKGHISRIVVEECNRTYRLFKERNPSFNGRVSLVGHSLGSAIMFDLLCQQKDPKAKASQTSNKVRRATEDGLKLDFEVEDFYALGSPIGLFQMLKGRTISARPPASYAAPETPASPLDDPFSRDAERNAATDAVISSPLCKQLYNIFHPTDPISYRLEPLISPAMSQLKPQPLPYTKKGIFGAPTAQGLTNIGARVGQGVTDFWTSVSSGIASGLLNRSLGITGTDASKMNNDMARTSRPLSIGPNHSSNTNSNPASAGIPDTPDPVRAFMFEERKRRLSSQPITAGDEGEHPPTLIDSEIQTLFAGFQKGRRSSKEADGAKDVERDLEWQELEERSRKLRKEEGKVRSLNTNGRVDYSIQEGAFDISLLASIASHLSYWVDEDVSHFMISQLLARHRVFKTQ